MDGRSLRNKFKEWADEAEGGYEVETLRKRGRPTIGDGPSMVIPVRMDATLLKALNELADERDLHALKRSAKQCVHGQTLRESSPFGAKTWNKR